MPWVKLYTEILDDPKMAELSASEKWMFIQLILLAGECDQEGAIPMSLKQIAWRLRESQGDLEAYLWALQEAGIITYDADGVFVMNFAKRQDRAQSVKRQQWNDAQKRHREKQESVIHDTSMTHTPREEESRVDKRRVEEKTAAAFRHIIYPETPLEAAQNPELQLFEAICGLTPGVNDYPLIIDTMLLLMERHKTDQAVIDHCQPFWLQWQNSKRKNGKEYNKFNYSWLVEWAVNGIAPPKQAAAVNPDDLASEVY